VLPEDTTGFEFHFPDGGLTLASDAFTDKAARINQAVSQRLRIVGIFRDDIEFDYRSCSGPRSAVESHASSPSHDQRGMLRPSGTSPADSW
jgi:hypothetical protein